MGSLLFYNDTEESIYWKKNIFKLESLVFYESILSLIFIIIAILTFPFDAINLIDSKKNSKEDIYIVLIFNFLSSISIFFIKKIHVQNNIKPNYRLCIMYFISFFGFILTFLVFIISVVLFISISEWDTTKGTIIYKGQKTNNKNDVQLTVTIYTNIVSFFIVIVSTSNCWDFFMEIECISKASKFLSKGNNINDKNLLFELFRIPKKNNNNEKTKDFKLNNIHEKEEITKFRLIMGNEEKKEDNFFDSNNNKFREVEGIKKVEYISKGVQTENDNNLECNIENNSISLNDIQIEKYNLADNNLNSNEPIIDN